MAVDGSLLLNFLCGHSPEDLEKEVPILAFRGLLDQYPDLVDYTEWVGLRALRTPLHIASTEGMVGIVKCLLDKNASITKRDDDGALPLHDACSNGQLQVVKLLLAEIDNRSGDNPWLKTDVVEAKNKQGETPLLLAAQKSIEIFDILKDYGASLDAKDLLLITPLHHAACMGFLEVVQSLTPDHISTGAKDCDGQTPLHYAVRSGSRDVVDYLLLNGAVLDAQNNTNATPLILAVLQGHRDGVQHLLTKGADPNIRDEYGRTPLHYAAGNGYRDIAECLLETGAGIDAQARDGSTSLHFAIKYGFRDMSKYLILNDAPLEARDCYDRTPLHYAVGKEDRDLAECLMRKGAGIDVQDNSGETPLHYVASIGWDDGAELLILHGAALNMRNSDGETPLHRAIVVVRDGWRKSAGGQGVARILLKHGASTIIQDCTNRTPFEKALDEKEWPFVEVFLDHFLDHSDKKPPAVPDHLLNGKGQNGDTPLHVAVNCGSDWVKKLLTLGASLGTRDKLGRTPLARALQPSQEPTLRIFRDHLKNKSPRDRDPILNAKDQNGETPLTDAASLHWFSSVEPLKILLEAGADCSIRATNGKSPFRNAYESDVDVKSRQAMNEIIKSDRYHRNKLHHYCIGNVPVLAQKLLSSGNMHLMKEQDEKGNTPLHYAVEFDPADFESDTHEPDLDEPYWASLVSGKREEAGPNQREWAEFVDMLLGAGAPVDLRNAQGRTILHVAVYANHDVHVQSILKSMTSSKDRIQADKDNKTALAIAFSSERIPMIECLLDAFTPFEIDKSGVKDELLDWASRDSQRHRLAVILLRKWGDLEPADGDGHENWHAIEWATYRLKEKALWMLIASSVPSKETDMSISNAEGLLKAMSLTPAEMEDQMHAKGVKGMKQDEPSKMTRNAPGTKEQIESQETSRARDTISYILRNHRVIARTARPAVHIRSDEDKRKDRHSQEFHAGIVSFYRAEAMQPESLEPQRIVRTKFIQETRQVREVIRHDGPSGIMRRVADGMRDIETQLHLDTADTWKEPLFTWIHLPVNNVQWMKDILHTIFQQRSHRDRLQEADDFFSASLVKLPRVQMMRPHCRRSSNSISDDKQSMSKSEKERLEDSMPEGQQPERPTGKSEGTNKSTNPMALYIPYLDHAMQVGNQDCTENDSKSFQKRLREAKRRYKAFWTPQNNGSVDRSLNPVHGSLTLDEMFYQDRLSEESLEKRNRSQIVTKHFIKQRDSSTAKKQRLAHEISAASQKAKESGNKNSKEPEENDAQGMTDKYIQEHGCWPILRVCQLWVWVVDEHWLITSSTHPIDHDPKLDGENEESQGRKSLFDGILEILEDNKNVLPNNVEAMAATVMRYCVDSYNRAPDLNKLRDSHNGLKQDLDLLSIEGAFSRTISQLADEESDMFNEFIRRMGKRTKGDSQPIRDAILQTAKLDYEIKDVCDELDIIKTVMEYQFDVWEVMRRSGADVGNIALAAVKGILGHQDTFEEALDKGTVNDGNPTMTVLRNIKQLIQWANKVHGTIEKTLELQHSEIAILQADQGIDQGNQAGQQTTQSIKQGQTLMLFTVVTILFLPLSFFTSLFALDVDSFLNAPYWAFLVIFLGSLTLFVIFTFMAFSIEDLHQYFNLLWARVDRTSHGLSAAPERRGDENMTREKQRDSNEEDDHKNHRHGEGNHHRNSNGEEGKKDISKNIGRTHSDHGHGVSTGEIRDGGLPRPQLFNNILHKRCPGRRGQQPGDEEAGKTKGCSCRFCCGC